MPEVGVDSTSSAEDLARTGAGAGGEGGVKTGISGKVRDGLRASVEDGV